MKMHIIVQLVFCVTLCYGQDAPVQDPAENRTVFPNKLAEKIGNFSIELLFHTSKTLEKQQNFIMSPITVWGVLAVIAEGAVGQTRNEVNNALRLKFRDKANTRSDFINITQWLQVNSETIQFDKINVIFIDNQRLVLKDFIEIADDYYQTKIVSLDFKDFVPVSNALNQAISNATHGKISSLVNASYFENNGLVITNSLYFKGQWSVQFNASSTAKMPFYDSAGNKIGEVNMMYNRHTYPFSNIFELEATVIELPYGKEDRLSMLLMLPNPGVSIEDMFLNLAKLNLDLLFEELRVSREEFSDDRVDCFIPRFKINSNIDLKNVLRHRMGIRNIFNPPKSTVPYIARTPLYVSKIVQKAEIEVTEEGTEAPAVAADGLNNLVGVGQFLANRPFTYIIVEKVTNSFLFGGFYKTPSLY